MDTLRRITLIFIVIIVVIAFSVLVDKANAFTNDLHCKQAFYKWSFNMTREDTQESGNKVMSELFQEEAFKKLEEEQLKKSAGR